MYSYPLKTVRSSSQRVLMVLFCRIPFMIEVTELEERLFLETSSVSRSVLDISIVRLAQSSSPIPVPPRSRYFSGMLQ